MVKAGVLIDGTGALPLRNAVVVIEGERITAVGVGLATPAGALVLDLSDSTVLPGFIDAHTHIRAPPVGTPGWENALGRETAVDAVLRGAFRARVLAGRNRAWKTPGYRRPNSLNWLDQNTMPEEVTMGTTPSAAGLPLDLAASPLCRRTTMFTRRTLASAAGLVVMGLGPAASQPSTSSQSATSLAPATMARIGTVDERFQSYNVEMLEVTGGRFWKPYGAKPDAPVKTPASPPSGSNAPAGIDPDLFQYRPPIDLRSARLRKLAAGLGPAYVRFSGTWANSTYFPESDKGPDAPPSGFRGVLTREQWKDAVDFSRAVDAHIVTSFATSTGTRDAAGVWTPDQARRFLEYTRSLGGRIAAAEFMNEPNFASMGGAPAGYDAEAYGRDFKAFHTFVKRDAPELVILGPGSVGESATGGLGSGPTRMLKTRDLLVASGPGVDAFSYHHYGSVSQRCAVCGALGRILGE